MTTKILCGTLGLGLAVAKGMVDKAPTTVAKGLDSDKALALFKELESIGNIVSIPGMEMKTKSPASDENIAEQKQTAAKKSAPSPSRVTTTIRCLRNGIAASPRRKRAKQLLTSKPISESIA